MTDKQIAVTLWRAGQRIDVSATAGVDVASVVAAVHPRFVGRLESSSGDQVPPSARLDTDVSAGAVLVLLDDATTGSPLTAAQREQTRQIRAFLRIVGWATALLVVALPWLAAVAPDGSGPGPAMSWLLVGLALAAAAGAAVSAVTGSLRAHTSTAALTWGDAWTAIAGALLGIAAARLLVQALQLKLDVGVAAALWLCLVCWIAQWALSRSVIVQTAARLLCVAAVAVTVTVVFPGGVQIVAPLLIAVVAVLVSVAPRLAPRAPDEQLVDVPLLITAAPQIRHLTPRHPGRVTGPRAQRLVREGNATWSLVTALGAAGAVIAGWPLAGMATARGLAGWSAAATLVATVAVLALAPCSATQRIARLAPRLAAAVMLAQWATRRPGLLARTPTGAIVLVLVAVGLAALTTSVAGGRTQGAPLLGRVGEIVQVIAQIVVVPVAFLASGLFVLVWSMPL